MPRTTRHWKGGGMLGKVKAQDRSSYRLRLRGSLILGVHAELGRVWTGKENK